MSSDAWYPEAAAYWADPAAANEYPLRYGDICAAPDLPACKTMKGKPWAHVVVLHPSCELGAKAAGDTEVLVVRVNRVSDISAPQRALVRLGWAERDGRLVVAHANTWWMPPVPEQADDTDWYADFRRAQRVPLEAVLAAGRAASLTHDARVYLIRRELYFRYRWLVATDQVRALEAERIAGDPAFIGPRPAWAT